MLGLFCWRFVHLRCHLDHRLNSFFFFTDKMSRGSRDLSITNHGYPSGDSSMPSKNVDRFEMSSLHESTIDGMLAKCLAHSDRNMNKPEPVFAYTTKLDHNKNATHNYPLLANSPTMNFYSSSLSSKLMASVFNFSSANSGEVSNVYGCSPSLCANSVKNNSLTNNKSSIKIL